MAEISDSDERFLNSLLFVISLFAVEFLLAEFVYARVCSCLYFVFIIITVLLLNC